MSFSLYDASVPSYLQILNAVANLLDGVQSHCDSKGAPAEEIIQARLAPDMQPFAYQISSVVHHSLGALQGVEAGLFSPDTKTPPDDIMELQTIVVDAIEALEALSCDHVDNFVGKPVHFHYQNYAMDFVAEEFLMSFSQPNFYFHATTAYDILRWKGFPIGKKDFIGQLRALKT